MRTFYFFLLIALMMPIPQDSFSAESRFSLDCQLTHAYNEQTDTCDIDWNLRTVIFQITLTVIGIIAGLVLVIRKRYPAHKKNTYFILSMTCLFFGIHSLLSTFYGVFTNGHDIPNDLETQLIMIIGVIISFSWSAPFFVVGLM